MEIISGIIQTTLASFDFAYCITVNILTYLIITILTKNNKKMSTWGKRVVLIIDVLVLGAAWYIATKDIRLVLNSAILAPVFWSWVMKPICKYFKLDYKDM